MKNNKGFTLIEVLAAVVILITILAIITPKIIKQFSRAQDVTSQEQINAIINIAKLYMNQNTDKLPENDLYVISLNELKESELIKTNQILDPSTKEELTGCIFVKNENNKYKYEYETDDERCNQIVTVTFDANGGTINQTSKNVLYNDTYGDLPTPTKDGYRFDGWMDKNLFNLSDRVVKEPGGGWSQSYTRNFTGNGIYVGMTSNNYYSKENVGNYKIDEENNSVTVSSKQSGYGIGFDIKVLPNTQYTISRGQNSEIDIKISEYKEDGTWIQWNSSSAYTKSFTTTTNTHWLLIVASGSDGIDKGIYDIQVEKGSTATAYDPYQIINSDTEVTNKNNHTLTAKWIKE